MEKMVMKENEGQRYIYIKHLMLSVLKKWPILILMCIILGLFVSIQYYQETKTKIEEAKQLPDYIDKNISVTEDEFYALKSVADYKDMIDNQQEYLDNSIIMNMNANQVQTCKYIYSIEFQEGMELVCDANIILAEYVKVADSQEMMDVICAKIGVTYAVSYLRECISSELNASGQLEIIVKYPDADMAKKISEVIKSYLEGSISAISGVYGAHNLKIEENQPEEKVDLDLRWNQDNAKNNLIGTQNAYSSQYSWLSDNAKKYLEVYMERRSDSDYEDGQTLTYKTKNSKKNQTIKVKTVLKQFIKGGMYGLVLVVGVYFLIYIFSRKVLDARNFEDMYNLKVWACLNKKKNQEKVIEHLVRAIDLYCEKKRDRNIFLIASTCMPEKEMSELIQFLSAKTCLTEKQFIVIEDNEYLTLEQAEKAYGVMFFEKLNCTRHKKFKEELTYYRLNEIDVIGVLVQE